MLDLDPRLLTVVQVAEHLGVSRSKVYELIAAGQITTVQIGRSRRISPSDLVVHRGPPPGRRMIRKMSADGDQPGLTQLRTRQRRAGHLVLPAA
jgi:excisionase family DNA binding protein